MGSHSPRSRPVLPTGVQDLSHSGLPLCLPSPRHTAAGPGREQLASLGLPREVSLSSRGKAFRAQQRQHGAAPSQRLEGTCLRAGPGTRQT